MRVRDGRTLNGRWRKDVERWRNKRCGRFHEWRREEADDEEIER